MGRRIAYALSKRVGSAVQRNRVRRRLRAIMAEIIRNDPASVPMGAMLVTAGPAVAERSYDELRIAMVALFAGLDARLDARLDGVKP